MRYEGEKVEEEETLPKLQPAKKTDQVWQSWLQCHVFMKAEEQCLLQYHDCNAVVGALPAMQKIKESPGTTSKRALS